MMYIVLCYDVGSDRVSRVRKVAKKYLHPVQRSVLEGYLTEGELNQLKKELQSCIDTEEDQVRAYVMGSTRYMQVHQLGLANDGPKLFL